jgi:type 2 lantibiotic biosynthesis protein LanM
MNATLAEAIPVTRAMIAQTPADPIPAWHLWLSEAIAGRFAPAASAGRAGSVRDGIRLAFAPLLSRAEREWRAAVQGLTAGVDLDAVCAAWVDALAERLLHLGLRTLLLELHVAKLRDRLSGASSGERFHDFFVRLSDRAALTALFDEYPVLAELIVASIQAWQAFGVEVLQHLTEDRERIAATFGTTLRDDPLVALRVEGGGDAHRAGRSVLFAEFRSGRKLVYKPRFSDIDRHFGQLLAWISARDDSFQFRTPDVLVSGRHGWAEFMPTSEGIAVDEVVQFYRRQGEYLALLYALDAADFHFENVLAVGSHPVLIDLEALFHPRLFIGDDQVAQDLAIDALGRSVLKVGLLPWRVGTVQGSVGADIGGMSAPDRQLSPHPVLVAEDLATDHMHLTRKHVDFGGTKHRPRRADGVVVDVLDHVAELEDGFGRMYEFLLSHRDAMLAADGPISAFAGDRTRVIMRATSSYSRVLQESFHPDLLRDVASRSELVGRLKTGVEDGQAARAASFEAVVAAEREDLALADVPLFSARIDSTLLLDSRDRPLPGVLHCSPLERVRSQLRQLSPSDRILQLWIVRASLATLATDRSGQTGTSAGDHDDAPALRAAGPVRPDRRGEAMAQAEAIGRHLCALAYRGRGDATWLGLSAVGRSRWEVGPLGADLYSGLPGVILFLAYLAETTGSREARDTAESATTVWLKMLGSSTEAPLIGGFSGLGGAVHLLAHLAVLWRRPELAQEAERIVGTLSPLITADRHHDVIAGSAGCIAGLLSLHHATGSRPALLAAESCGEQLLAHAVPQAVGLAWPDAFGRAPSSAASRTAPVESAGPYSACPPPRAGRISPKPGGVP